MCDRISSTYSTEGGFASPSPSAGVRAVAVIPRKHGHARSFLSGPNQLFFDACGQLDMGKRDLIVTGKIMDLEIDSDESLIGIPKACEYR